MNEDLRTTLRGLAASPLFTGVAIASLALGIGANAAIFSLLDQVLLRSLPVKNPHELIQIYQKGGHYGNNRGARMNSYPLYKDYRDKSTALNGVVARRGIELSLAIDNSTERLDAEIVSGNYFEVLGVGAAAGRLIGPDDDRKVGAHPVAVLSYDYWQSRFSGDTGIVGKTVRLNNHPFNIIGVSAKGFTGIDPAGSPSVRVPMMMKKAMTPGWDSLDDRRSRWVQIFARVKPGYSLEAATSALQAQFRAVREEEVKAADFAKATPYTKEQFLKGSAVVVRAANGYSDLRQQFSQPLWILMGIVSLVLLIACSNVANLLIARALSRRKELAVRVALGASRWRLMRPLLLESSLLSLAGGVAGLALAFGLNKLLLGYLPTGGGPLMIDAAPDWRIFGFTFALAIATGLLFGLLPAFAAARTDAGPALKQEGRGQSSGGSGLVRKTLVGVQVALSVMLLIGAGLFVRSLQNLKNVDLGLRVERLVSFQLDPALNGYTIERLRQLQLDLLARVRSMPGVERVGLSSVPKMHGFEWDSSIAVEGRKDTDGQGVNPYMDAVSPGYVEAMGMRIVEGRDFRETDRGKEATVALINKKFADKHFGGKSPLGRHVGFGGDPGTPTPIEVIGVFSDARYENVREDITIQMLVPLLQGSFPGSFVVYVRAAGDEAAVFGQLRGLVKQMDASLPIYEMRSFATQVEDNLSTERLVSFLAAAFGVIATILAAIGLYGVLSLAVSRRTKEIGIRLALGAEGRNVIALVLGEIAMLIGGGILVGVPAALLLSRYVESQLYGLKATDPLVVGLAVGLIVTVALAASLLPARRATKVNPIQVLHYE